MRTGTGIKGKTVDKEYAKRMAIVLQGIADGKDVQERDTDHDDAEWLDYDPASSFILNVSWDYRIKPEPREFWLDPDDHEVWLDQDTPPVPHAIKVREVLE